MYSPPQGRVSGFSCETRNAIPTASGRRSVLNGTEVRPTWSAFLPAVAFPEEIRRLKGISLRGTRRSEFLSCSKAGGRTRRNLLSVPTQYLVQFLLWGHSKLKIPKPSTLVRTRRSGISSRVIVLANPPTSGRLLDVGHLVGFARSDRQVDVSQNQSLRWIQRDSSTFSFPANLSLARSSVAQNEAWENECLSCSEDWHRQMREAIPMGRL